MKTAYRYTAVLFVLGRDTVNRFNHTRRTAIVTPTDRPKSVRSRCVIEVFGGVFVLSRCFFVFFCRCRGFCHRTESDLFLFLIQTPLVSVDLIGKKNQVILELFF